MELEVGGATLTRSLEVAPDPRVDLPASAYAEQFELARGIEALRVRVAGAARDADNLQKGVTSRLPLAGGRARARLEAFQTQLIEITGAVPTENPANGWWLPPRSLESLRALGSRLGDLQDAVDGADAAPSPDARAGFAAAETSVERGLAAWQRLRKGPLADLEKVLEHAGLPPL